MPESAVQILRKTLKRMADPKKAAIYLRFFKTGKGQYGEGDTFYGITVPKLREVARGFRDLSYGDLTMLLSSHIHEERFIALIILLEKNRKADESERKKIFQFYLKNASRVNNWDLVDVSAKSIVGGYVFEYMKDPLVFLSKMAGSKNLWERRMAIISAFHPISKGCLTEAFFLADVLLHDSHDLMHKAVGWVLREAGKKDRKALESFLIKRQRVMPRTTLRYAIEKFSPARRRLYLKGKAK